MNEDEFVSIFSSIFGSEFKKSDFTHCKPEFVQRIYSMFLKDFTGNIESLNLVPFNAPDSVHSHPEMYRSSIFFCHLAKSVKCLLKMISDNDEFTLMDILNPTWSRTRKFFTIFTKFYLYVSENLADFEEMESEVEKKRQIKNSLIEKIETLKDDIKKRECKNVELEVTLEKNKKELEMEKEEIEKAQELKERLKGRLEGIKKEILFLITKTKDIELQILEGKENIDSLRNQVMEEDEMLEVKAGEERLATHIAANEELKASLKEVQLTMQAEEKSQDLIKNVLMPLLDEIESEANKEKEILSEKNEAMREMSDIHEKHEQLSTGIQRMKEDICDLQEQISQLKNSRTVKIEGLKSEISQLKLTLEELKQRNEEQIIVEQNFDSELKNYEMEINSLKENLDEFLSFAAASMQRVSKVFTTILTKELTQIEDKLQSEFI